tara:strand:+ start:1418 stop:1651 length:234 start_codon:yes stop_codon:yes gene_type:complete
MNNTYSNKIKDHVLNWDRLQQDIKDTLVALSDEYGTKQALGMYKDCDYYEYLTEHPDIQTGSPINNLIDRLKERGES